MSTTDRHTAIPPAPSLWSRFTRSIRATWIHDPVARAIAIAALSFIAFGGVLAVMLTWPGVAIPIVATVGVVLICGAVVAWVKA